MLLKNRGGRIVRIPDEESQKYIKFQGFSLPSDNEIKIYEVRKRGVGKPIQFFHNDVSADGYGESGRRMSYLLQLAGYKINAKKAKVSITYLTPCYLKQNTADYKILFTMFESTDIPDSWVDKLKLYDEILVPSEFCRRAFRKYHDKVRVVNLGYNEDIFKPLDRPKRDTFNFLHYNAFNIRKGFLELVQAFKEEFKEDEPVKLVLKCIQDSNYMRAMQAEGRKNIEIIHEKLPLDGMMDLLSKGDCFVFPSRGEGFGLTPLEAMATGMPAIVVNQHGIKEYFDQGSMIGVKSSLCPSIYRKKYKNTGQMHKADIASLKLSMRYAYEHQDEMIDMGKKAIDRANDFTSKKCVDKLYSIIEGHL